MAFSSGRILTKVVSAMRIGSIFGYFILNNGVSSPGSTLRIWGAATSGAFLEKYAYTRSISASEIMGFFGKNSMMLLSLICATRFSPWYVKRPIFVIITGNSVLNQ